MMQQNVDQQAAECRERLPNMASDVLVDSVGSEYFVAFHVLDSEQSSFTLKQTGGSNFEAPGPKATGVTLQLPTPPGEMDVSAADARLNEFVNEVRSTVGTTPPQVSVGHTQTYLTWGNIDVPDLLDFIEEFTQEFSQERVYGT